ncbi:MAG: hypothetical protein AB7E70_20915 [Hyphomicrobiaceae bacterium]
MKGSWIALPVMLTAGVVAGCSVAPSELRQREPVASAELPMNVDRAMNCIAGAALEIWTGGVSATPTMQPDGAAADVHLVAGGGFGNVLFGTVRIDRAEQGSFGRVWIGDQAVFSQDNEARDLLTRCGAAVAATG